MQKFVSALAVLALVGGVTLTGCKEASVENQKGMVTAFDATAKTATIDGTNYTVAEGVVWPMDLAVNDSVSFSATGAVISALDKINRIEAPVDSLAAGVDSLAAGADAAIDSAQAGAADALQGAANALDSAAKH